MQVYSDLAIKYILRFSFIYLPLTVSTPTVNPIPVTSTSTDIITLGPDDIQTELNFSCTAETQGSFQWTLTSSGVSTSFADANRTSYFTLTPISADSAESFSCVAMDTTDNNRTGSKEFSIQFQPGKCLLTCIFSHTHNILLKYMYCMII